MASINGIELKGLKEFKGHEQEPLTQGNIYYKGKKVGWYSQDSYGGEDYISLAKDLGVEVKNEVEEILNSYESDTIFSGISELYDKCYGANFDTKKFKGGEYLFADLIRLQDHERIYKKFNKKWNINNIAICYKDLFTMFASASILPKEEFKKKLDKDKNIKLYYLYSSLEDFKLDTRNGSYFA